MGGGGGASNGGGFRTVKGAGIRLSEVILWFVLIWGFGVLA